MRVFTAVKNNPLFRWWWWILTLPLEFIRVVFFLPLYMLVYVATVKIALWLWLAFWFVVHFHLVTVTVEQRIYALIMPDAVCFAVALVLMATTKFSAVFRYCFHSLLGTGWRLSRRVVPRKDIEASIVIKPTASPRENRERMTARLSPELQRMISGVQ